MSLVPLTVYLPRAQLVQLERRAALAGISRSGFAARAVLAALSGALYAHYAHYIAPQDFDLARSVVHFLRTVSIANGSGT